MSVGVVACHHDENRRVDGFFCDRLAEKFAAEARYFRFRHPFSPFRLVSSALLNNPSPKIIPPWRGHPRNGFLAQRRTTTAGNESSSEPVSRANSSPTLFHARCASPPVISNALHLSISSLSLPPPFSPIFPFERKGKDENYWTAAFSFASLSRCITRASICAIERERNSNGISIKLGIVFTEGTIASVERILLTRRCRCYR